MYTRRWLFIIIVCCCLFLVVAQGCEGLRAAGAKICNAICPAKSDQPDQPSDTKAMVFSKIWPLFPAGILGITVCIFMILQGQAKWALPGAIALGVMLVLSAAMVENIVLIAWIGTPIIAVAAGFAVWKTWLEHKKSEQRKVAVAELVETGEEAKVEMSEEAKAKMFGRDKGKGLAGEIQSPEAEALVKEERIKLGVKSESS